MKNLSKANSIKENRYLLWGLIAIELFMSFSFLGYIHIEPISLTFVYIPVMIAGCILGPREAALIGAIFGLASMWKASAFYVGIGDAVFSPVMSGKPIQSIVLGMGTRMLFGFIMGLLYYLAKRGKHPIAGIILVTSIGRTLHSLLVYGCMGILFPETGFDIRNTLDDTLRWDFIPFLLIADVIVVLCYRAACSAYVQKLRHRVQTVDQINDLVAHYSKRKLALMIFMVLLSSFSVAYYFTNRIKSVMKRYEIVLSANITYDLLHLQIQFLLGMISLALLVIIIIILYQKNFNYLDYEARSDELTGLLGRRLFFKISAKLLENRKWNQNGKIGCFLILDVDRFKEINDRFGHPAGDKVLREVADNLRRVFSSGAILGRLGGDEFVVLIYQILPRNEIERILAELREESSKIRVQDCTVTCSIGAIPVEENTSVEDLYRSADRLLYEAKKKGKDQFVFGDRLRDMGIGHQMKIDKN